MKHSYLERLFTYGVVWGWRGDATVVESRPLVGPPKHPTKVGGEFDWGGTSAKK